jgi:hypothetical protein
MRMNNIQTFRIIIAILIAVIVAGVFIAVFEFRAEKETPSSVNHGTAPATYDAYASAVDTEFAKELAIQLSSFGDDLNTGFRTSASPAESKSVELISQTMADIGLKNITTDDVDADGWVFGGANLDYTDTGGQSRHIILGGYPTAIHATNEVIPLVVIGNGYAADYEGKDVEGKLVLLNLDANKTGSIDYFALQAKQKGARAALIAVELGRPEASSLISLNSTGPIDAPALAISVADAAALTSAVESQGYEDGNVKQIDVHFNAASAIQKNAVTHNVWGEIPGESSDTIYFISHYDGYYHAFDDDAVGTGLMLGIAKAMIESGYKPEKTIRFVAHGAQEWGLADNAANRSVGAWEQLTEKRPEWPDEAFAVVSIDGGSALGTAKSLNVSVPYEMKQFADSSIESFGDRSDIAITVSAGLLNANHEDFVYNIRGIPTIAINETSYNRSSDTFETGGYSDTAARVITEYFGYSAMMLDELPLMTPDFSARFNALNNSFGTATSMNNVIDSHLLANVDRAVEAANSLDDVITSYNTGDEASGNIADMNNEIRALYRRIQEDLLWLDVNMNPCFENEVSIRNISLLEEALAALKEGNYSEALTHGLMSICASGNAAYFDKETCDYYKNRLIKSTFGTWAEGHISNSILNVDEVTRSLAEKLGPAALSEDTEDDIEIPADIDVTEEIEAIEELISGQEKVLGAIYKNQNDALVDIMDAMNRITDTYQTQKSQ